MRRHVGALIVAGIAALAPLAVRADQVLYFTNGTSMEIRGHTVEGAMIRVDLGGGSVLGFPNTMVERIEDRGQRVYQNPAYRPANQAVAGSSSGAPRAEMDTTAIAGVPPGARFRQAGPRPAGGVDPNDPLVQAAYGEAGVPSAPRTQSASAGNGRIKVRGRMSPSAQISDAPLGAVPEGGNFAIDDADPGKRTGVSIMSIQPKSGTPAPPPSSDAAPAPAETEPAAPPPEAD
jgi:hypothetical protein